MANLGSFDPDLRSESWLDSALTVLGWMDVDLIEAAGAAGNITVTPDTVTLALSSFVPQLQFKIIPGVTALTLTTFDPVVSVGKRVIPDIATLTLTTFAPVIRTPVTCTPGKATLTLTTFAPKLKLTFTPGTTALSLGTFAPQLKLKVIPGVTALTLTTFAPKANIGVMVVPGIANLSLTTFAPVIVTPQTVIPGTATLVLTTYVPRITVSGGIVGPSVVDGKGGGTARRRNYRWQRINIPIYNPFVEPLVRKNVRIEPSTNIVRLRSYSPDIDISFDVLDAEFEELLMLI